ncbi:FtsX-like permease family protein [Ignavibacteria bacterium 4148-Me]|uniref:ABC transporter permease n=1 Tax=Rosettibacter primus TaxID=3111523 RepID=UPI00336C2C90
MIFQLAWKNIWRNKKRSLILILSALAGIWGGIFANSIFIGMWETTIESAINRELSHIQIHNPEYLEEKLINQNISDINKVREILSHTNYIKNFSERTIIDGIALSTVTSGGVKIIGIQPEKEKFITSIHNKLITGRYLKHNQNNEILIGRKLAERLKLKVGSKLVLSFQDVNGNLVASAFRVTGIFRTESSIFDERNCFVNSDELFSLTGRKDLIHEIAIRLNDINEIEEAKNFLQLHLTKLKVDSWKDLAPEYSLTQEFLYLELNIFMGIILFAILFGISNTMMMSVYERIREFGVLLAIGMKRIRLFSLIVIESVILLFTGGIIGTLLGFVSIQLLQKNGVDLSIFGEGLASYGISAVLYPELPLEMYLSLFLMMLITSIFAALSPAIKAVKLKPAEAIRSFN